MPYLQKQFKSRGGKQKKQKKKPTTHPDKKRKWVRTHFQQALLTFNLPFLAWLGLAWVTKACRSCVKELGSIDIFWTRGRHNIFNTYAFFLDSFLCYTIWAHHSKFFSVKDFALFSHLNNFMGFWEFSCSSYISLYIISILQIFDCQLHVGKTQAKYYCN